MSGKQLVGVDTHCHIDLYPDPEARLKEAEDAGLAVVAVTNTPSVFRHMAAFAVGHPSVYPALGFHPELAVERAVEIGLFRELAPEARFIGEVGLDGTMADTIIRQTQREVFSEILATCRKLGGKILTVHSRRAAGEVIEMIDSNFPGAVILHWFTGSQSDARKALDRGMYFSVNPAMLRSRSSVALVKMIPRDRVLTETDGPFVKVNMRPAAPVDVASCVRDLASLWGQTAEETSQMILTNFRTCMKQAD